MNRLCFLPLLALTAGSFQAAIRIADDGYHVSPGDDIQVALDQAAQNPTNKTVKVHPGIYRPHTKRPALIWFNRAHDGVRLEAVGRVILTAANPEITRPQAPGYPAVVNHVVYFGHGISTNTLLDGFELTGANRFVLEKSTSRMEPDTTLPKNAFFYTDGGGIKVFGRSSPMIRNVRIVDNNSSPCGAGVSIQQQGFNSTPVQMENCVFLRNRAQVTGAAVDLLEGSAARLVNCLFVGNISNLGPDVVAKHSGEKPFTNSGVVTVFPESRLWMDRCTLTGNRNGVDDMGGQSVYTRCIFYQNTLDPGLPEQDCFELYLPIGARVTRCLFSGDVRDPRHSVSEAENVLKAPPPQFDAHFAPQAAEYGQVGYRPVGD